MATALQERCDYCSFGVENAVSAALSVTYVRLSVCAEVADNEANTFIQCHQMLSTNCTTKRTHPFNAIKCLQQTARQRGEHIHSMPSNAFNKLHDCKMHDTITTQLYARARVEQIQGKPPRHAVRKNVQQEKVRKVTVRRKRKTTA